MRAGTAVAFDGILLSRDGGCILERIRAQLDRTAFVLALGELPSSGQAVAGHGISTSLMRVAVVRSAT
jgi:hypothetical protein